MTESIVLDASVVIAVEIAPIRSTASPLEVRGVELDLSANEIVAAVREGRER